MKLKNGKKNKKKRFKIWKKTHMIFNNMKHISFVGESIYTHKARIVEAEEDQINLLKNISINKSRPKTKEGKNKKKIIMQVYMLFIKVENELLMLLKKEYLQ